MKKIILPLLLMTLCWLAVVAASFVLPKAEKMDIPSAFGTVSLWTVEGTETFINPLGKPEAGFRCTATEYRMNSMCGLDVALGDGQLNGADLSDFSHVHLRFDYSGSERSLRLGYRNSLALGETVEAVQHEVTLPIHPGENDIIVPFDQFVVPAWWRSRHSSREAMVLENDARNNVTHLGFDLNGGIDQGVHELRLNDFRLQTALPVTQQWMVISAATLLYIVLALVSVIRLSGLKLSRLRLPLKVKDRSFSLQYFAITENSDIDSLDIASGFVTRKAALNSSLFKQEYPFATELNVLVIDFSPCRKFAVAGDDTADSLFIRLVLAVKLSQRQHDVVVRWSKNEIIILCPKSTASELHKRIKQIRRSLYKEMPGHAQFIDQIIFSTQTVKQGQCITSVMTDGKHEDPSEESA